MEKRTHRIGTPFVTKTNIDYEEEEQKKVQFSLPQNYIEKRTERRGTPFVTHNILPFEDYDENQQQYTNAN